MGSGGLESNGGGAAAVWGNGIGSRAAAVVAWTHFIYWM